MANIDSPFGLRPVRHKSGAPYNGAAQPYYIPGDYATALYIGDPVVKIAAGSNANEMVAPGLGKFSAATLPAINKSAVAGPITGVIVGFGALPDSLGVNYNPASTERIAWVVDDPDIVFEVQTDDAVAAANIGLNANLVFTHDGNTSSGLSGAELDGSSAATTATLALKILRAANREDNEGTLIHAKLEVIINNHTQIPGVAGI